MELAEAPGDIDGHPPTGRLHVCQADVSRYARDVRIQRNHKLARNDLGPDTTVDAVLGPHHPSQIQIHPLTGASLRGTGEKESNADATLEFPARIKLFMAKAKKNLREAIDRLLSVS